MKKTVEIDDTLQECVDSAIDEVREKLIEWLDENHDCGYEKIDGDWVGCEPDTPDMGNDLDYSGSIHETIDSCTPIYYHEIDAAHYLHGNNLEQAYEDAGIGDKSEDNWKQVAIFCYIEQVVSEWYNDNADEVCQEWFDSKDPDNVKDVEYQERCKQSREGFEDARKTVKYE